MLLSPSTTKQQQSPAISELSIGGLLLAWTTYTIHVGVDGLKGYVRSYDFVQQVNLSERIKADYSKDTRTYVDRLTAEFKTPTDLYS